MLCRATRMMKGLGLGLVLGLALGAAGCTCMCSAPNKRKIRRKLMHTADSMGSAIEHICYMIK